MLSHFPTRKFEQIRFDELLKAWEPTYLRKTPSFHYLLPRVRDAFGGAKAREVTTERIREFLDRLKDHSPLVSASSRFASASALWAPFASRSRHST